jgi:hypothetical protein
MTKKTWELMGKPKLIYSPIRLRMVNHQYVSPFGRLECKPILILLGITTYKEKKEFES